MRRHQISIHALREEGDLYPSRSRHIRLISIHALREEGDPLPPGPAAEHKDFYPRPPRGGRPLRFCPSAPEKNDFYPRPPRGGRLPVLEIRSSDAQFLSTPSARRATKLLLRNVQALVISIHALREEGDLLCGGRNVLLHDISIHALREEGDTAAEAMQLWIKKFLSTPSARRATQHSAHRPGTMPISIHALREEGDITSRGL